MSEKTLVEPDGDREPATEPTPLGRRGRCPRCGSRSVAEILFGLPEWSEELEDKLDSGRLVLGGCCVTGSDPDRHCNACDHRWRSRRSAPARLDGS